MARGDVTATNEQYIWTKFRLCRLQLWWSNFFADLYESIHSDNTLWNIETKIVDNSTLPVDFPPWFSPINPQTKIWGQFDPESLINAGFLLQNNR